MKCNSLFVFNIVSENKNQCPCKCDLKLSSSDWTAALHIPAPLDVEIVIQFPVSSSYLNQEASPYLGKSQLDPIWQCYPVSIGLATSGQS